MSTCAPCDQIESENRILVQELHDLRQRFNRLLEAASEAVDWLDDKPAMRDGLASVVAEVMAECTAYASVPPTVTHRAWVICDPADPTHLWAEGVYLSENIARRHFNNLLGGTGRSHLRLVQAVVSVPVSVPAEGRAVAGAACGSSESEA